MCGIAGIVGRIGEANRAALKRMGDAMSHRGPDGEGFWEAPPDERGFGPMFAHRRLSILDLSPAGAQPMVDPASGDVLVTNGEIYNYVELRERLVAAGEVIQSTGDTAVMLRALGLRGQQAIATLRGMFAFAYWDRSARKLVLARDPLGIKPLYVAHNPDAQGDWTLAFASEVRALLASGLLGKPRLNPQAAASVAWNGFVVSPHSAIVGIEPVWPGEFRVYDAAGREAQRQQYWSMPAHDSARPPIEEPELAAMLEECVRLHLASDVPLGVFLSGGVDSSAVANLAQKTSTTPVHTFTLSFGEAEYDESAIARRVADSIGTQHQELVLTEQHFVDGLERALDSLDQPTFDGLNSYYMSRVVRDAGFTVALVGTGGDELFGGYTSFRDLPPLLRWSRRAQWTALGLRVAVARMVAALMQPSRGAMPQQTRWAKLPAMVKSGDDLLALYQLAYALFLPEFQDQLLADPVHGLLADGLPAAMRERLVAETQSRCPLAAISVMEQRLFLGERLLRDTDAASMAASLETRLPLVDQVLLENVDRLPTDVRYQPVRSKAMLRRIGLRGLDPKLFERPKSGFVLPYDRWLRSSLGRRIDATMRDPDAIRPTGLNPQAVLKLWQAFLDGAPGLYWSRVWAVYVLIRWCHRHGAYL